MTSGVADSMRSPGSEPGSERGDCEIPLETPLTIVIPDPGPAHKLQSSSPDPAARLGQALAAQALLGLRMPGVPAPAPAPAPTSPAPSNSLLTLALAKVGQTPGLEGGYNRVAQAVPRRPRGEKKPIPEDLKDNKASSINIIGGELWKFLVNILEYQMVAIT